MKLTRYLLDLINMHRLNDAYLRQKTKGINIILLYVLLQRMRSPT